LGSSTYKYKIEDMKKYFQEKYNDKHNDYIITKKETYDQYDGLPDRKREQERQQVHDECIAKVKSAVAGEIEWEDWMNGFLEGKI